MAKKTPYQYLLKAGNKSQRKDYAISILFLPLFLSHLLSTSNQSQLHI